MPTDNSAYRQNVQNTQGGSTNTSWRAGDVATSREVYSQIARIYNVNKEKGLELANKFQQLQNSPTSRYYNPYNKATNQAVGNLASMGIDASGLTTEWFNNNKDWQKHLVYSSTTNSPVSPGKKATAQQQAAFQMYQVAKAAENTQKVDNEWAAMQQEIFYWTQRTDLNLSDDDIIAKIEKEKKTKYPTLYALDNSTQPGQTIMELNHGTTYSKDNMYGAIFQARNGRSAGSMFADNILSAGGKGTTWKANEDIARRLDRSNKETYSPFSAGMTADDVGAYFNVRGFNDKTLSEIEKTIDWDNEIDVKMYNKAKDALETTKKAEAEQKDLIEKINGYIADGMSEEKILERLDKLLSGNNYATLKAMDKSIERRDSREDMVQTAYAVDYRKQDVVNAIKDVCKRISTMKNANSIAYAGVVGTAAPKTQEQIQAEALEAWNDQHKDQPNYTDSELRKVRTEQEAADVAKEKPVAEPTQEEIEAAYDNTHGKGAYKRDIQKSKEVASAKGIMDAKDQEVRDAALSFGDDMNAAESAVLKGYSGSQEQAGTILKDQKDAWLKDGIPDDVVASQTQNSNKGYIEEALVYNPGVKKYEQASQTISDKEQAIADTKAKLGLKYYVGRTNDLTFETEMDGNKYRVTMLPDLSDVESIESFDENGNARPVRLGMFNEGPEEDSRIWEAVRGGTALNAFREKYLSEQKLIDEASGLQLTEEDEELRAQLRQDEMALEDAKKYVSENQDQYAKDKAEMERTQQRRDEYIKRLEAMGQDTTSAKIADAVLDNLYSFNDYEATKWQEYNPTYAYSELLSIGLEKDVVLDMAKKEHEEIEEQLKDIEFLEQYLNDNDISLPGDSMGSTESSNGKINRSSDVWNNIQRRKAKLQRDLKDAEFFETQFMSDFEEVAAAGKAAEEAQIKENTRSMVLNPLDFKGSLTYEFEDNQFYLTDDEKKTFYYLTEKDRQNGTNKAREYADFLNDRTYGVLSVRRAKATEEAADKLTDKSFVGANLYAIALSPYTAIASLATNIDKLVSGRELNPYDTRLNTMRFRSTVRETSAENILNTFGKKDENGNVEETTMSKLVQGFYEMVSNRADSAINAAAFGWMFGGIGNDMLQEFLGASPMGMSAATEAAMKAKEKGASDEQAYGVAAVTFFAETATEAISLEHMSDALKIGKEASGGTWKKFLVNWLTKAGISEAFGESLNDIFENLADEKIMGEMSEHAERVKKYRTEGYGEDEAEAMARKDEIAGVLRTAVISYLSPGLDAFRVASGRYSYYRAATEQAQAENPNVSLRQVRREIINQEHREESARKKAENAMKNPGKNQKPAAKTEAKTAPESNVMVSEEEAKKALEKKAPKTPEMSAAEKTTIEYEILETAKGGDKSVQNSSVAAVLNDGATQEETDTANAAAANLHDLMQKGKTTADEVQDLLLGADMAGIDQSNVKRGIVYAALGGENSECRLVMQSDEYQTATMDQKAKMLSLAVTQDFNNQAVSDAVNQNIHEYRVARTEGRLMEEHGAQAIANAETAVKTAEQEVAKAQQALDVQNDMLDNARKAVTRISSEELGRDPSNDTMTIELMSALDTLQKQSSVQREYAQSLANAQQREQAARENAEKVRKETLTNIRQQAQDIVAQEDQQRAAANEQAKADAQAAAEQKATQEKIDNETASSNAMDAESFIEKNFPNATDEEKKTIRDTFSKVQKEVPAQQGPIYDENGNMTPEAQQRRDRFVKQVSKKFGVNIEVRDTTNGGTVDRQNGYYVKNKNLIVIDQNCSVDDAMYFVLGHELTHMAEQSGTYKALQRSLLKMRYGYDDARLAADIRTRKAMYDERLARMHEQDSSIDATPLTEEQAAQEITADIMGELLRGNKQLIDQLVAEEPSTARRILESIKSFLKKAVGMKGAWKTNAQKTVDLFEQALKDAQGKQKEGQTKYSLPEAQPIATDKDGTELAVELPGGTVAVNEVKYSLNTFTPEEQNRVRQALYDAKDENGKNRFTKEEVDQYLTDAMGIASMIAADRQRLDFQANPAQRFLKPNNDYYFTLDASTLCAKRLLYQGTFDYVQHALPDEVFTPEDLIDLVNIMSEMGYETPCGICYVESRRRWLDTYAHEFLENIQEDPDGFINKRFKKASAEEKAALRERLAGEMPSIDDLTTSDGLEKLRNDDPLMHKAFVAAMNAKGSANPKVVQLRTEYNGDIRSLSAKDIQKVKDIGGLRIQSFSDFETPHLLDMIQAVMDMSSVGLTSQAYTKVPNFAWVFGDTGIKINLSLIGKGTGLDADGNLVFDNVEGMNFDEAMRLRDRYSKNVGTILVGINDEHIIAAMGDSRIDFIIPFHKSGWSAEELRKMPTLNNYLDYTDSQNERLIVGERKNKVKVIKDKGLKALNNWIAQEGDEHPGYEVIEQENGKYTITYKVGYETESFQTHKERTGEQLSNFEPVGANQYWEFDHDGEWNARKYLQMCADAGRIPKFSQFLVDNGDGSFSLPEGDDKRSTAIRKGYWKTLIDFKMYDNDGNGAEQQAVTPNINMDQAQRVLNEHKLGRQMPDREDGRKGIFIPMESNNDVPVAVPAGDAYIQKILEKRRGNKPTGPNDTLKATPPVQASNTGESFFHQDENATEGSPNATTAAMASGAEASLGNMDIAQEEFAPAEQGTMAIDSETGETVRTRYSLPSDAPYMAAVERGEMDEAQRMVDEKAEQVMENSKVRDDEGNLLKVYHGTTEDFTVFDPTKSRINMDIQGMFFSPWDIEARGYGDKVGTYYLDIKNPAPEGVGYAALNKFKGQNEAGRKAREYLISQGYDGVANYDEFIAFYPEQIKSADATTYDNDGNVIPLSERFNDQNPDIRYSLPSDDILEQQIRQYIRNGGSIPNQNPNTAPAPRFNQPKVGEGVRQFAERAQESDELFQQAKDRVWDNRIYKKDSDAAGLNRALDWIQGNRSKYDPDGYVTSFMKLMGNPNGNRTKDGQARMVAMMALAAAKNDGDGQSDLAVAFEKQGTAIAQALQFRKLFKLMTPQGRVLTLQKLVSDQQKALDNRGVGVDLKLSQAIYDAAAYATEDGEFEKVRQAAYEELAQQIPASWKDRLRSWRMLSMLANPRTHIRNVLGNAMFVPAVSLKNKMGAIGEIITGSERTKTLALAVDKDIRDFARKDAETMKDVLTGEAKFSEAAQIAKSQKKLGKAVDWLSDKNSEWLEKEDWLFLKGHYRRALGGWMQANGYTVEQVQNDSALLEKGREYAINEAQKATYRDFNKVAQKLNQISRDGGALGFLVDAALPFKKTPANILKRGIEYSPVGLMKSLTVDMYRMKQYMDYENGKLNALPEKAMSPNQVIDHICSGLSGTLITLMGFLLAGAGVVTCGLDDDEDKLKKLKGEQEYAVHLKLFGQDVTYTMDWAAPMSMPFFVGAAIRDQAEREGGASINEIANALGNISEPVFNLSMLDGINSLFKTSQYDDTNTITQILAKIVTNYGTSYVPSALGATTRTFFDDTRRRSYVTSGENSGIEGTLRYAWEQVENKLPGLSKTNIPYRDVWGNAEASGLAERILENFISPGYASNYKDDPVVNELSRLYEATGDANLIPKDAEKSITYKNTKYALGPEDYDKYVVTRGQAAYNGLTQLMNTDAYKKASEDEQKEQVKKVWDYANQLGKAAVIPDYKITAASSVEEAANSGSSLYYQDAMITSLTSGDYQAYATCVQALHDLGVEDSKIKTKISNTYRERYKDAYRKRDMVTMLDIEDILDRTGFDFNYQSWQDAVDEE